MKNMRMKRRSRIRPPKKPPQGTINVAACELEPSLTITLSSGFWCKASYSVLGTIWHVLFSSQEDHQNTGYQHVDVSVISSSRNTIRRNESSMYQIIHR